MFNSNTISNLMKQWSEIHLRFSDYQVGDIFPWYNQVVGVITASGNIWGDSDFWFKKDTIIMV